MRSNVSNAPRYDRSMSEIDTLPDIRVHGVRSNRSHSAKGRTAAYPLDPELRDLETALAFGRRGDRVYATMREAASGDQLRAAAASEALLIVVASLDVADGDAVKTVFARIVAAEQRIDVQVNNAGIPGITGAIEEIDARWASSDGNELLGATRRSASAVFLRLRHRHL